MNKQQRDYAMRETDRWITTVLRGNYMSEEERLRCYIADKEKELPQIKSRTVRWMAMQSIDRAKRRLRGERVELRHEAFHPDMCPVIERKRQ